MSRLRVLIGQLCQSLKRRGHVNIKEKTLPVILTVAGDPRAVNEFLLHQIHFYVTKRLYYFCFEYTTLEFGLL